MRKTAADILVECLILNGVTHVFGIPGTHTIEICDSIRRNSNIKFITTRNESGCGFMAAGFAKASGNLAVCLVVPGPGLLNAASALATAYSISAPVLCIAGQIPSCDIDKRHGVLHEIHKQSQAVQTFTNAQFLVTDPCQVEGIVQEAIDNTKHPVSGPVLLEMPIDVQRKQVICQDLPKNDDVHQERAVLICIPPLVQLICAARSPLIIAGGGSVRVKQSIESLAEHISAPVVLTGNGRSGWGKQNELCLHLFSSRASFECADLVIAIGTRLNWPFRHWNLAPHTKIISINPRHFSFDHGDVMLARATAEEVIAKILADVRAISPHKNTASISAEIAELNRIVQRRLAKHQPQASFSRVIESVLRDDCVLVIDSTLIAYYMLFGLQHRNNHRVISSGYFGAMGSALPMAIGVSFNSSHRVICIVGDGGFLLSAEELATAQIHRLDITIILFNDNAYGEVKNHQIEYYENRITGTELHNPDFAFIAAGFGIPFQRLDSADQFERVMQSTRNMRGPFLVEIKVQSMPGLESALRLIDSDITTRGQ